MFDIGIEEHDQEGRSITAEFDQFFIVGAYVPFAMRTVRKVYREKWEKAFLKYLYKLKTQKPVIFCGDLNVAHKGIDHIHPDNFPRFFSKDLSRIPCCTPWEQGNFSRLLKIGNFVDTFRHLYPDKCELTSWWNFHNCKKRNCGMRIDYFLVSKEFMVCVRDSAIHPEFEGSDHCPVSLTIQL